MGNYFKYYPEKDMIINKVVIKPKGKSFEEIFNIELI